MKYIFRKDKTVTLSESVDGKQDYQKHVGAFVSWKDVRLQKSYNFPGNANFKAFLLDLLNIKLNWSY